MDMEGDLPRKTAKTSLSSTDDLSGLSEAELSERLDALDAEMERTRAMLKSKEGARSAAASVFKT